MNINGNFIFPVPRTKSVISSTRTAGEELVTSVEETTTTTTERNFTENDTTDYQTKDGITILYLTLEFSQN